MSVRLNNPYDNTATLRSAHMFFGRTYLLQRIYSALANKQNVSLEGSRHIGKSSLLHYLRLPEVLQQFPYDFSRYIFVLLDLREYLRRTSDDFFDAVSRQITLQSRRHLTLERREEDGEDEFSSILDEIKEQGYHTVLLMDSFDNVTRNSNFDLTFFSFLRSQATLGKVSYVTATIAPLDKVCHSSIQQSPFFNIFSRYKLEPLTPDEAHALATVPTAQTALSFTAQEVSCALDLAGRHPFFIQRVCYKLLEEKYHLDGAEIDNRRFSNVAYDELEPYFGGIWERLVPEQQVKLKNLVLFNDESDVEIPELSESLLFRRFILAKFDTQRFHFTVEILEEALDKLNDMSSLGESDLQHLRCVSLRARHAPLTPSENGLLIRELLNEAFERMRGNGYRSDGAPDWKFYNILYYRYFKHHLKNEQIVARIEFMSTRQFFRERKKAIEALYNVLLEMETNPGGRNKT